MESFDYEIFITLVEGREVLWNKHSEIYKDKRKSLKAWFEICDIMIENFAELPNTEKNKHGKLMTQKWKHIRDAWMKCHKKMSEAKSGSGAKRVHKYQYYDNLQFLKKNCQPSHVSGSNILEEKSKSEEIAPNKRKNKQEMNVVDNKMVKFIESLQNQEESRMMSFFKGIAPTVDRFKDEDIVEFQYQVLNIMRNIQYKNNYSAPHQSHAAETFASSPHYGYSTTAGPSSRNQSPASSYSMNNDSLQSIASPAHSSLNDLDFSVLNEIN